MREIQALDPTVDPDQAIRTPCAPAAPAVPKAPAAPATPAAAQALKLTDAAARLGEALCGVPTERNPSTHPYPGLHPGLVCRAPLGHPLESSTALSRLVEALLSAGWGQAVCAGRGRFKGQAAGSGRIAGGAPRDRACARREARGEGIAFALRARGLGDRLQCSLRLGPAAAWGQAAGRDGLLGGRQMF